MLILQLLILQLCSYVNMQLLIFLYVIVFDCVGSLASNMYCIYFLMTVKIALFP
uniref:G-protein coupled receptors family 1 profile domain-containing protein n=1 Tax=Anguilla anguilla TaxID=7936 RepID=A0A0E9WAL6_ANGAN